MIFVPSPPNGGSAVGGGVTEVAVSAPQPPTMNKLKQTRLSKAKDELLTNIIVKLPCKQEFELKFGGDCVYFWPALNLAGLLVVHHKRRMLVIKLKCCGCPSLKEKPVFTWLVDACAIRIPDCSITDR